MEVHTHTHTQDVRHQNEKIDLPTEMYMRNIEKNKIRNEQKLMHMICTDRILCAVCHMPSSHPCALTLFHLKWHARVATIFLHTSPYLHSLSDWNCILHLASRTERANSRLWPPTMQRTSRTFWLMPNMSPIRKMWVYQVYLFLFIRVRMCLPICIIRYALFSSHSSIVFFFCCMFAAAILRYAICIVGRGDMRICPNRRRLPESGQCHRLFANHLLPNR